MNAPSARHTFAIEARFDRALKLVRASLTAADLEIAGEIELRGKPSRCLLLLVDCPLLVFEGLALDRAAGVYFPLHVVLSCDGRRTWVATSMPFHHLDARPPAGAAGPVERLAARVRQALRALDKSS